MEHGALRGLVVLVGGPDDAASPVAAQLRAAGASVVVARPWLARAVAAHIRPDVAVAVAASDDPEASALAEALARDPALYPLATVLTVPREFLRGVATGAWTATVGLPAAPAELLGAVRAAAQLRRAREELMGAHRRLEHEALTDPLTGRPNRRYVERSLDALASAARRHGRPLSLVLLDLDDFKVVNDRHGHATGDAILRGVCDRLAARLRAEDVLGRVGGDELVILLPETDARAGRELARSLAADVASTPIPVPGGTLRIRATAGHAALRDGERVDELLARADRALYAAKRAGGGDARSAEATGAA